MIQMRLADLEIELLWKELRADLWMRIGRRSVPVESSTASFVMECGLASTLLDLLLTVNSARTQCVYWQSSRLIGEQGDCSALPVVSLGVLLLKRLVHDMPLFEVTINSEQLQSSFLHLLSRYSITCSCE